MHLPVLNFPEGEPHNTRREEGKDFILDPIRKKYVRLTPEEWVRQHLVRHLIHDLGFPAGLTAVETGFVFQGMQCRADVLVHSRQGCAVLMAECKAPDVEIEQDAFDQIGRYNSVVRARYLVVTNGLAHFCCEIHRETDSFRFLDALPRFVELRPS